MNLPRTTIVLYRSEPDPHVIRLRPLGSISDFSTDARVSLSGHGEMRAGVVMRANGIISIAATGTRLNTKAFLQAAPTVTIGTDTHLPLVNPLAGAATIQIGTVAPLTIIPTLNARSTIPIGIAPPRLTVGGIPLRAQPRITLASNNPKLSRTAQFFTARPTLHLQTNATLRVVGQSATDVLIVVNGAATLNVRLGSIAIDDVLNEAPNTCTFIVDQRLGQPGPPPIGADVRIGLRDTTAANLLFAGTVKTVEPYYELAPKNPAWAVTCDDYTFLINRRKVFGTWTNVSATQVALEIVARFTAGFSTGGVVGGLPPITVTFRGETVMDALTQIANLIGGYAGGPDYNRVIWLFITDPRLAPDPVSATHPLLMIDPPVRQTLDLSQTRTRVDVQGAGTSVGGPPDTNIDNRYNQLPLEDSQIFTPGQSGQVITEDAQIVSYGDVMPGKLASYVRGNVAPPVTAPLASIAPDKAGDLEGRYLWRVSFGNANGETDAGPATFPQLLCEAFPTPINTLSLQPQFNALGPLVGKYDYVVTFITSKGESHPSARSTRTAIATAPPATPSIGDAFVTDPVTGANVLAAGPLKVGATYGYEVSYTTLYGETRAAGPVIYTPTPLPAPTLESFTQFDFGGLQGNADYLYGVSAVTAVGETYPPTQVRIHTAANAGSPGGPAFSGFSDFNGRIAAGNYAWACSYYHDTFGETALGPTMFLTINPAPPGSQGVRIGVALPTLSGRAKGLRLYRGFQGNNPWALVGDFRSISGPFIDYIAQTEAGNPWPIHPLRGGGISVSVFLQHVSLGEVVARRIYRSKANGTELFLLAELQHNQGVTYFDEAADAALTVRGPVVQTTGHRSVIVLPVPSTQPPTGYVGRRLYRTKANGSAYYRLADLKEMSSLTLIDTTPDESLTGEGPVNPSTAGGECHFLQSIPKGPTGTLARRIYRTVGDGVELRLLVQISDNTTTTFLDNVPDAQLNADQAPLVNTAGAAAVLLSNVPVGPVTITQRHIYRTKAIKPDGQGANEFFYVGSIANNVDTTFIDDKADRDLGRLPVTTSTIGVLAGERSLVVNSAAGWPTSGWVEADSQVIRYDGISYGTPLTPTTTTGDTLQNIPPLLEISLLTRTGQTAQAQTVANHGFTVGQRVVVLGAVQPEYNGTRTVLAVTPNLFTYLVSGAPQTPATTPAGQKLWTSAPGAITGAIAGSTTVLTVPMLTGVSGILVPLKVGSAINLWVVRNSVAGQQALAALEGGDGVHEFVITDADLKTVAACAARGDAELLLFQDVGVTITYVTRDRKTRSGALVSINLPTPTVSGSFRIAQVHIDQIDLAARLYPRYTVTCSTTKFSLTDLLRHVVLKGAA